MRLLEAATWIYKSPKKKQPFRLRALLLERKELHAAKRNNDDFSGKIMTSDSLQSPSLIQGPLSRPTASTISVPGRPAKPSAEANMLKWCACWTCKYDSWHPWRGMPKKKKILSFSRKPNRRNARDGWISVQDWLCSDLPLWEANCVIWMQKQYFHSYRFHEAAPEHRGSLWPVNPLPGLLAPTYPMRRSIIGSHSLSLVPIQDDTICDSLFTLQ